MDSFRDGSMFSPVFVASRNRLVYKYLNISRFSCIDHVLLYLLYLVSTAFFVILKTDFQQTNLYLGVYSELYVLGLIWALDFLMLM